MAPSISFSDVFVLFVMTMILLMYIRNQYGEVAYVESKLDGRKYLVRKLPDDKEAADRLARLNKNLSALVAHLAEKYGAENADIRRLRTNYNPNNVSEGGLEHGYTSYSVNKGEKIVMCIRQKDRTFVDDNVVLYVAIHELAHLMTDEIGHTQRFWDNFRFILSEAIDIGIYTRVDYKEEPQEYCGINLTSPVV